MTLPVVLALCILGEILARVIPSRIEKREKEKEYKPPEWYNE